jgi:hypothetical protein
MDDWQNYTEEPAALAGGSLGANLDLERRYGPYRRSTIGMGIIVMAISPRTVDAHRGFKVSNICRAKSWEGLNKKGSNGVHAHWEGGTENTT